MYFHRFQTKPNKIKIFVYLEELPLNIHVRNVDYIENGCERLSGTLYMTKFRLVFAPDNETGNNNLVRIILHVFRGSYLYISAENTRCDAKVRLFIVL